MAFIMLFIVPLIIGGIIFILSIIWDNLVKKFKINVNELKNRTMNIIIYISILFSFCSSVDALDRLLKKLTIFQNFDGTIAISLIICFTILYQIIKYIERKGNK